MLPTFFWENSRLMYCLISYSRSTEYIAVPARANSPLSRLSSIWKPGTSPGWAHKMMSNKFTNAWCPKWSISSCHGLSACAIVILSHWPGCTKTCSLSVVLWHVVYKAQWVQAYSAMKSVMGWVSANKPMGPVIVQHSWMIGVLQSCLRQSRRVPFHCK